MDERKGIGLGLGALALIGGLVYRPALAGGWIWDDPFEITQNSALREPGAWWRIWLRPEGADYYPLKTSVQWAEWRMWGNWPVGYHVVNLAFHVLAAFLLWRVLSRLMEERAAFFGGLLFLVHPLAVESVAWISELKNGMSLAAALMAGKEVLDWDRGIGPGRPAVPWRALGWFFAAMLCKSSVVMFPVVLLLYFWWRRGRVGRREALATLPFFGVAVALGLVTVWFQWHRAIAGLKIEMGSGGWRLGSAALATVFYFAKAVAPLKLMPIYPDWTGRDIALGAVLCGAALVAVGWWARKRGGVIFGIGFFVITLLPVLGFVPMSYLRISRVADHLCYWPLVGLIGLAAAAMGIGGSGGSPLRRSVLAGMVCLGFAFLARTHAEIYRSPLDFWTYAVEQNPRSWLAQNSLGMELLDQGKVAPAVAHLRASLRLKPDYADALNNLGDAFLRVGQYPEARRCFEQAIRVKPDYAEAYCNLGTVYIQAWRFQEALALMNKALSLKPDYASAYANRGVIHSSEGNQEAAIRDLTRAIELNPDLADAELDLGLAYARIGRFEASIVHYRRALRIRPAYALAHNNLGNVYYRMGRVPEAAGEYEAALQINPGYAEARNNLAEARKRMNSGLPHP